MLLNLHINPVLKLAYCFSSMLLLSSAVRNLAFFFLLINYSQNYFTDLSVLQKSFSLLKSKISVQNQKHFQLNVFGEKQWQIDQFNQLLETFTDREILLPCPFHIKCTVIFRECDYWQWCISQWEQIILNCFICIYDIKYKKSGYTCCISEGFLIKIMQYVRNLL